MVQAISDQDYVKAPIISDMYKKNNNKRIKRIDESFFKTESEILGRKPPTHLN
jgi:hypothetical protein